MNLIIGSHVSFTKEEQLFGSLKEALSYGANTFMFYTGAPQNTNRCAINDELTQKAYKLMEENNIDIKNVVIHAPYIINLANRNNMDFGIRFLNEEIGRAEKLGVSLIVLHPGSHVGVGYHEGIKNIIECLNLSLSGSVKVLIETMAGKGSECGITLEQVKLILDGVEKKENIGVCLDTCHLNDSGININDFDKYLEEFDKVIGIDKIGCVHVNDSKNIIGAHKDRHENFGFGTIGFNALLNVVYNEKLKDVPKILETPYVGEASKYPPYKFELDMIREKEFNQNLIEDVINYYK